MIWYTVIAAWGKVSDIGTQLQLHGTKSVIWYPDIAAWGKVSDFVPCYSCMGESQ